MVDYEKKKQYEEKIRGIVKKYQELRKRLEPILLEYGKNFFDYAAGKITESFIKEEENKTREKVQEAVREECTEVLNALLNVKEKYLEEKSNGKKTEDPVELTLLSKELEVMETEELKQFYDLNQADANKMRLFQIELKKRKRFGKEEDSNTSFELELYINQQTEADPVLNCIKEQVKVYTTLQGMKEVVYLMDEHNETDVFRSDIFQLIAWKDLKHYVESKSGMARPTTINLLEF